MICRCWRLLGALMIPAVLLAVAACGSSGSSTPAPSSSASVDGTTAYRVCVAVGTLVHTGSTEADAIARVASAYYLTRAQVVAGISEWCPALKQVVPGGP